MLTAIIKLVRLGPPTSTPDPVQPGSAPPARSLARPGPSAPLLGLARLGPYTNGYYYYYYYYYCYC